MTDITIPVKGIYFDQIKDSRKLIEYRLFSSYWHRRLADRQYRHLILTRGYPKGGGVEGETRLTMRWNGCVVTKITHPHFGPDQVEVFGILANYAKQAV